MNDAATPRTEPRGPTGVDGPLSRKSPSIEPSFRGVMALCLASFGVMVPWPLLGILLTHTYFKIPSRNNIAPGQQNLPQWTGVQVHPSFGLA